MKQDIKTLIIVILVIVFVLNTPVDWYSLKKIFHRDTVGVSVTTISSSDLLSDFPTTYNANLNALNNGKPDIADVSATTSLASLAVIGTVTTGTWNASVIDTPYGGTGWSTIASGTLLYGKGSSAIGTTTAGSDGQILTLVGGTPNWASPSVDTAIDYTWTGHHIFSSLFATLASSTNATTSSLYVTGNQYTNAVGTSTAWVFDANGKGTLNRVPVLVISTTTEQSLTDLVIPLSAANHYNIFLTSSTTAPGGNGTVFYFNGNSASAQFSQRSFANGTQALNQINANNFSFEGQGTTTPLFMDISIDNASSTMRKNIIVEAVRGNTGESVVFYEAKGWWNNPNTLTSITFTGPAFAAGTQVDVYAY